MGLFSKESASFTKHNRLPAKITLPIKMQKAKYMAEGKACGKKETFFSAPLSLGEISYLTVVAGVIKWMCG